MALGEFIQMLVEIAFIVLLAYIFFRVVVRLAFSSRANQIKTGYAAEIIAIEILAMPFSIFFGAFLVPVYWRSLPYRFVYFINTVGGRGFVVSTFLGITYFDLFRSIGLLLPIIFFGWRVARRDDLPAGFAGRYWPFLAPTAIALAAGVAVNFACGYRTAQTALDIAISISFLCFPLMAAFSIISRAMRKTVSVKKWRWLTWAFISVAFAIMLWQVKTDADNVLRREYTGPTVADDVDLSVYMPDNADNRLARLAGSPSWSVSENFPIIDGATAFFPIYAAVANETYRTEKAELPRYVTCSKTPEAYNRLIRGEADVIFVLQPSDEQMERARDAGVGINLTPVAREAFVFFVNERNPVSALSIKQIRDIYLKKITNWRSVGGGDKKILSFQRPENSGSQTAMIKEVMKGKTLPRPLEEEYRNSVGMGAIVRAVAIYRDQEESIGYSVRFFTREMTAFDARRRYSAPAEGSVKLIDVDGIAPTEQNIRNGTYPLTVDIYAAAALIAWLLSPQGQSLVEKTGYVGVN
jgi:phosphate transport system substrate-binding protein